MKEASGNLALQVTPSQSFEIVPNDPSRRLEPLADSPATVTIRGQLYKKSGKKKPDLTVPLKLVVIEVEK
jgi:hypothetical protein